MNNTSQYGHRGIAWLELLWAISILVLLLELFPSAAVAIASALDVRLWTSWAWFTACASICVVLCAIRYGPDIADGFAEQRQRAAANRVKRRQLQEAAARRRQEAEERQLYQRMRDARRRQA